MPEPSFGAIAAGAHVVPLGLNLAVGGLLFGIGMVIAGGCVSGTLYRIGEGYLASWASLLGILLGLSLALRFIIYYPMHLKFDPWTYRFFPTELTLFLMGMLSFRLSGYCNGVARLHGRSIAPLRQPPRFVA